MRKRETYYITEYNNTSSDLQQEKWEREYMNVMSYAIPRFIICITNELNCVRHKGCVGICGIPMLCRTCVA